MTRTEKSLDILARLRKQADEAETKYQSLERGTAERCEAFDLWITSLRDHNELAAKLKEPTI